MVKSYSWTVLVHKTDEKHEQKKPEAKWVRKKISIFLSFQEIENDRLEANHFAEKTQTERKVKSGTPSSPSVTSLLLFSSVILGSSQLDKRNPVGVCKTFLFGDRVPLFTFASFLSPVLYTFSCNWWFKNLPFFGNKWLFPPGLQVVWTTTTNKTNCFPLFSTRICTTGRTFLNGWTNSCISTEGLILTFLCKWITGGQCWSTIDSSSGRCNSLIKSSSSREKCCSGDGGSFAAYSDRDLSSGELFFLRAFRGGVPCQSCMSKCLVFQRLRVSWLHFHSQERKLHTRS